MPGADGSAGARDVSAGRNETRTDWRWPGGGGGDSSRTRQNGIGRPRASHRSGKMVAADLQLPALLPAGRGGTGENVSGGSVSSHPDKNKGCRLKAALKSDRGRVATR